MITAKDGEKCHKVIKYKCQKNRKESVAGQILQNN
jgi:hypothetical protein